MTDERLYINGNLIKLEPNSIVAKTLQVNDIHSLDSRQANFTRTIDIPKTPENIKALGYLSIVGNNSNIPYQRNSANYYIGNDCVIYEGWAKITETDGNSFKCNIYDGTIDLYKAIENKSFSDISLSGLTHEKSLSTVIGSWSSGSVYKYILADYNGKGLYDDGAETGIINIDYLVPSVNVKYLWDSIFNYYGLTYSGNIFSTANFTNLWMTYPKGVTTLEPDVPVFQPEDDACFFIPNGSGGQPYPNTKHSSYLRFNAWEEPFGIAGIGNNKFLYVGETGRYRVNIAGTITSIRLIPMYNYVQYPTVVNIWLCKNQGANPLGEASSITPLVLLAENVGSWEVADGFPFEGDVLIDLQEGDDLCVIARSVTAGYQPLALSNLLKVVQTEPITFTLSKANNENVSFDNALADVKLKDFMNEILWRFGLTIFPEKYTSNYDFLTLEERLASPEHVDWTNKFQGPKSEKYVYSSYAQKNNFRYSYNDTQNTHKDASITIDNVNLEDSKDCVKSKIYAPELEMTNTFGSVGNVYKLWNKEVKEVEGESTIVYKGLDKRFYFMRSTNRTFAERPIGSEQLSESQNITSAPFESFSGLSFSDLVTTYYPTMQKVLDKSKMVLARFNLTPKDVANFDFKKLHFVGQLGGYFLVNKISNYQKGRVTDVELIKVDYAPELPFELGDSRPDIIGNSSYDIIYNNDQHLDYLEIEGDFVYEGMANMFITAGNGNWYDPNGLQPNIIRITDLPNIGTLYYTGEPVVQNQEIDVDAQGAMHFEDDVTITTGYSTTIKYIANNTDGDYTLASTMTLNVAPAEILEANNDSYSGLTGTTHFLNVLENDSLGEPYLIDYQTGGINTYGDPTGEIKSIDISGFSLGTVTIANDYKSLQFEPNGELIVSSFTYTIEDYTGRQSTATVTIDNTVFISE